MAARTTEIDVAELLARAETLEVEGRAEEARELYAKLARDYPDHPAVLHRRALVALVSGKADKAEALLRQALATAPDVAALYNALALALLEQARTAEAETQLHQAVAIDPRFADAHYNLGTLLEEQGRIDEALGAYQLTVTLQPEHAKALLRMGALLRQRGELQAALEYFERVLRLDPESFDAHYYRGWVLSELRRDEEALRALEQARRIRPDRIEAEIARANALRDAGRYDQALEAYWALIVRNPRLVQVHAEFNRLCWTAGRHDRFLQSFAYARERIGDDPELMYLEAAFRLRRGDYAGTEALLRRALVLAPQRGDLMGMLARALAAQAKFDESYVLFAAAIHAEPAEMLHREEFGFTLLKAGRADQALRVFEQALAAQPFDQTLLSGLTLAYRALGDGRYQNLVDFSRYVRVYDLPPPKGFRDAAEFNRMLAVEIDALHKDTVEPIDQTLRGGTQTAGQLFAEQRRCIQLLHEAVTTAVADYVLDLPEKQGHPICGRRSENFRVAGSWSCRLRSGGYHNNHIHPQGWISSAYYIRVPEVCEDTESRPGWLKFGESNLALGGHDRPAYFVRPAMGRLVLFPSFYWHGTTPFEDGGDRLAVSFDVAPR
ncbi:MAG: tetratricopeptide repeat protein [Sinobacteraceae bacterium]|nr:tetratricopeptide repeat protein [Nevskiaceae bacterium]